MDANKVELGYWSIRGLAQRVRMLLEYVELPYDQVLYTAQEHEKWFKVDKPNYIKKNPAVNLPYLKDGDKIISEVEAVLIYICHRAKKQDLLATTADEQVALATTQGVVKDLHVKYIDLVYGPRGGKAFLDVREEYFESFKPLLTKLNLLIEGKDYYCGKITYIDFGIADFMQTLWLLNPALIESFPNVWNHQKRIWDLPAIKAYHETDKYHEHPCNSPSAAWY